jgi:hypothetical protein
MFNTFLGAFDGHAKIIIRSAEICNVESRLANREVGAKITFQL